MKIVYAIWGRQCDDEWLVAMFETREQANVCCDRLKLSERGKYIDYEIKYEEVYASCKEFEEDQAW